jgi:serralysin
MRRLADNWGSGSSGLVTAYGEIFNPATFSAVSVDAGATAHVSLCLCAGCCGDKFANILTPTDPLTGVGPTPVNTFIARIGFQSWVERLGGESDVRRVGDDGIEEQNAGFDTVAGSTATTFTIAVGGVQNGFVNTVGDDDWYRIDLVAGQTYEFSLVGGTLADPYLELYDSAGSLIAFDDDFGSGINSLLRFTAPTSGVYYVNARGFEGSGASNTGSYTLTANLGGPISPLDSIDYHFTMPGPNIAIWFAPAGFTNPSGDTALRAWTQTEINAVFAALATFSAVTPLTFSQAASAGTANWTLSLVDLPGNTLGYFSIQTNGYGAFDPTVANWTAGLVPGGNSWVTLIHEFGHGLGLAHPHDNGASNYGTNNSEVMQGVIDPFNSLGTFLLNQGVFTTMTYNDGWRSAPFGANFSATTGGQSTPMALDIALLQQRYGVNPNTNSGDTTYNLLSIASSYQAIWDTGGSDTIAFNGALAATIDLRAATLLNAVGGGGYVSYAGNVHGGFTIANGVVIENATGGSGADTLIGNDANNILNGGAGIDNMSGGLGDDFYIVDNTNDVVTESSGAGTDTVQSSVSYQILANVENLTLVGTGFEIHGTGNGLANVITGDGAVNALSGLGGNDQLIGNGGNDTLNGGDGDDILNGGVGADAMTGGNDNDTYIVDNAGDTTVEALTGGVDLVQSSISWTLADHVENLTLTGAANINGLGNGLDNTLLGNSGANTLDGGVGADAMGGGAGDDTYYVDALGDAVTEAPGEGDDLVFSTVSIALLWSHIERLTLTGAAALNAAGNDLANTIQGNDGANTLSGGLGNDVIDGGLGNDTITWSLGDGSDAVDGGADIDTFAIAGDGGESILDAVWTGSALTQAAGNSLSNIETVTAAMGGGIDWLIYAAASAGASVNLAAGTASGFASISGVERVIGGNGGDALTGDGFDNRLDGQGGDDVLVGGSGLDTLLGGAGADTLSGGFDNDSLQGGAGDDVFNWSVGDGRDTIDGGADNDTFNATGSAGADLGNVSWNGASLTALINNSLANIEAVNFNLGGGIDWLIYSSSFAVNVNLALGAASGFASISNIERVIGGSGGDTLTGDGLDNRLDGQGGADTLDGGAGSDAVLGGDGDDIIYASAGNDSLQGQNGNDSFIWTSSDGRDTFNGGAGTDAVSLTGSAVADVADANWNGTAITGLLNNALIEIEAIHLDLGAGGTGGDWLRYNTSLGVSVNLATGAATGFASITGVENLIGGTGNDTLTGDAGANKINANAGDDIVTGGGGNDNLTGGAGSDTFVYAAGAGNDTINDFDAWADGGQDFLDISGFGINAADFAARVAIIDVGNDTVIRIDNTIFITLKNVTGDGDNAISQADFILGP